MESKDNKQIQELKSHRSALMVVVLFLIAFLGAAILIAFKNSDLLGRCVEIAEILLANGK